MHELLIQTIEKHVVLSEEDKEYIKGIFLLRKVKKGQYLVHEGAICRNQTFIIKGSVITYFIDFNGYEHIVQLGIEGWWIGDLQSYFFQKPATCNVKALEDSEVLECSYEKIQKLYDVVPQFERYQRIITQLGYISFQQRVLQNLSLSAEDRYIAFREKYPKIELRLPQKIIASYLGISPEFMSKIKKKVNSMDKKRNEG